MMRTISNAERRARLGVRHHLARARAGTDVASVAGDLVGLHATDPKSVYLGAWARIPGVSIDDVSRALYDDRTVLRMLGMRRTLFVLPVELARVVHAACSRSIAQTERRKLLRRLADNGVASDPERWLRDVEEATLRALRELGEATATELVAVEPRLATKVLLAPGRRFEAWQGISVWVLLLLAAEGRIARGRPRGTWISTQYRWAPMSTWIPGGLAGRAAEDARVALVARWLGAFGPGTVRDIRWWTGLTARSIHEALARVEAAEVRLEDGGTALVLADDAGRARTPAPWVALLPPLDSTVMGWAERDWYLSAHRDALFDRNGNAGPTVWSGGRVVGGWGQRPNGEIVARLLEDPGREAREAIDGRGAQLSEWLAGVRLTPRFATPLQRELSR